MLLTLRTLGVSHLCSCSLKVVRMWAVISFSFPKLTNFSSTWQWRGFALLLRRACLQGVEEMGSEEPAASPRSRVVAPPTGLLLCQLLLLRSSHLLPPRSPNRLSLSFPLLLPAMAAADLSEELECSLCLDIYTDPVSLTCSHNFCRVCIDRVLDSQEGSAGSCPECREEYEERPGLHRNIALRNIAERFLTTQPDQEGAGVHCTYCIHSPVPAVMSCLHCDASMCDNHLRVHSKAPEHVLCAPTTSPETRKCSVHKKILEYYCTEDAACVCVSCYVIGGHVGHKMMSLNEASKEKKKKLRNDLQKLMAETEEAEKRVQSLEERRRKTQEKADGETERVTALFRDLRRRLEKLEKRVLSDIMRQVQSYDDIIRQLEIKKEELSRKMRHIEELCNMTDPLTVLQESHTGDLCDTEDRHDKQLHDGEDLDVAGISHTLHTGLADIMSGVTGGISAQPADILLDVNTAHNWLYISDDRKTVSWSLMQNRPETPERFQDWPPQVLSSRSFSSGRHYWEVDVGGSDYWTVGMCYPSIDRRGGQSLIGDNNKSWCLDRGCNHYSVIHDRKEIRLPDGVPSDRVRRVRIDLDYEAGQVSFYAQCDPIITHLYTFTATFTEPLHAGLYVRGGRLYKDMWGESGNCETRPLVTPQGENCDWLIVQPILISCL
ncbi:E3 ubiquitin-protein ligase TRIM11-like [Hyperolius riggenbachi]|uniref:E3 ubiquitin-protein ligase TRIM11-like n=1 Tax=Hyperolius riggenbachi TaxID=752182 RepID=UPI0035A34200